MRAQSAAEVYEATATRMAGRLPLTCHAVHRPETLRHNNVTGQRRTRLLNVLLESGDGVAAVHAQLFGLVVEAADGDEQPVVAVGDAHGAEGGGGRVQACLWQHSTEHARRVAHKRSFSAHSGKTSHHDPQSRLEAVRVR